MRTSLQQLILDHLSKKECRYTVDVENGVLYTNGRNGVTHPMKPDYGMVTLYIKSKPYRVNIAQLVYLVKNGKYPADAEIIHLDGITRNNRCSNLAAKQPHKPLTFKKAPASIVETIIKMHDNGLTPKEISEKLLIPYHVAYHAVSVHKSKIKASLSPPTYTAEWDIRKEEL